MFFEDELSVSRVKLTYRVPEEQRDLEDEDEYRGDNETMKHIYGDPLIDASTLYVSDMYFTDRSLMKGIFKLLQK